MKSFETYIQHREIITENDKVFQMYVMQGGVWKFRGLVSEKAKDVLQSQETIDDMNSEYVDHKIFTSFTGKQPEEISTTYMFVRCEYAEVSTFKPRYKDQ